MSRFAIDLELAIGERRSRFALESAARAIAIVGPSGVGKSTLLRAIAGLAPARGRVSIDGVALDRLAPEARRIGWAPQDARLFPHLTVRENLAFPRSPRDLVARAAALTGIDALMERAPATLSGGERQRVAIARALACAPRLLLLDEPLAALDREARAELSRALRAHASENDIATILVAHDESDVAALSDEVFAMGRDELRSLR